MTSEEKLNAVIAKLEESYGVEQWQPKKRDVLDSLIKTVLSQSTSDWNRDLAWEALKQNYPRWEEVIKLSKRELAKIIRPARLGQPKSGADFGDFEMDQPTAG